MTTRAHLSERDWAIMYLAWMNDIPLSDTIWRFEAVEKRAASGVHSGDCTKEPHRCDVCALAELLDGGKAMAEAWRIEASNENTTSQGPRQGAK